MSMVEEPKNNPSNKIFDKEQITKHRLTAIEIFINSSMLNILIHQSK